MTSEELQQLDEQILIFLKGEPFETGTGQSVTLHLGCWYQLEDINAALWRLLNEGKLEWTPDFCFRVAEKSV